MASEDTKVNQKRTACRRETRDFNDSSETWNEYKAWKWRKPMRGYGFIQYWIINYPPYKKIEKTSTIVCGIKSKHEEPFQDNESA
jgi:hypothetical protein